VLISLITLFGLMIKKNDQLYEIEEKIVDIIVNSQSTTSIELKLFNSTIKKAYYDKQEVHHRKTDISIERFVELFNANKIILAKNSSFHNIDDCNNYKYISRDGHDEYIVKVEKDDNGNNLYVTIVTDPINKGTYNIFNQEGSWWQRNLHHIDLILWLLYGTSYEDQSTIDKRLAFYFNRNNFCGG